jgi:hypothetical protein
MADYALDLFGSGEDVKLLIFAALKRRFGPFDDVREIILKPNPKLRKSREDQFVRDTAPPPSAEMTFLAGWGDIRTDCVIGRFAKNELYLNTWLYDAVRALNLHYWMTEYAKANRWAEAMQCAGRLKLMPGLQLFLTATRSGHQSGSSQRPRHGILEKRSRTKQKHAT